MRLIKIFLFTAAIFLVAAANASKKNTFTDPAKSTLSGKVTDKKTGLPLEGASVYFSDLKKGTITTANGNYSINNLPNGNYLVEVKFVGYKSALQNISIQGNVIQDFSLEPSVVEENEVVVTGTSKATSIKKNPIPIVSIGKQYLQQNLSTNIIDAIAKVPGINAVTTGPNVSKPYIRGLGFSRILTLYDGVRQEGQQWGDEHGIEVDQNSVEKVEVVKGPASLIYGSDALAGVINLIPANFPSPGKTQGDISAEYQTNNGLFGGSAMLAGNKNSIVWRGRASYKEATNYRNKYDGRVYNTGFRETDLNGMIGVNKTWGYSHIGFSVFDDLQDIPDGSRDSATRKFTKQITEADTVRPIVSDAELTSYAIPALHQHVQHYRIYTANNFILKGGGRIALNLGYQKSIRREYSHPEIAVPGLYLLLNTYSYDAKYYLPEKNGWSITGGVNGMYQNNDAEKGTEFVIPSYKQFDFGPFLFAKKSYKKLELAGGIRYDMRTFNNDALFTKPDAVTGFDKAVYGADTVGATQAFYTYKHTFSGLTGSLGATYSFSKTFSAKFNVARGYRSPNISEISANGVHPGTNIYQLGNLNFKPEFSLQEDIGLNYNSQHITVNLELFNNNIQNYIFNQKVLNSAGQDSVIIPGNETFQFQAAKAHLYGTEISIDLHPHPLDWLHFENSLSLVYGTNKGVSGKNLSDSAKYLPFIPPMHTFSELRANIKPKSGAFTNLFAKMQFEWYAKQDKAYLEFGTETPTPGYSLFNIGFGGDVVNQKKKTIFNFSILANNLFDVAYQSHLNRLKYFEPYPGNASGRSGIYNMGRNVAVKLSFPLNFN
ncbi:TonB-dependent receptor [Ferruginibacter sp. SUN106]|uniref:TonB-dependent receptor n=1 Tax=Ferruginibacter sp. SUN106 TaxID=2978348 RepID=UPI003D36C68B